IPEQMKAMVGAAAALEGQSMEAQAELSALRQIYSDHNVRVRALSARVAELAIQLKNLRGPAGAQGEISDAAYPSIRQLPLLGVHYADLYRQTKIQEAVYETLTKQVELAKVEEAKEIPTVRVLDASHYPERRSSPRRLLVTLACGLLAVAGAAAGVVLSAWWT